MACWPWAPCGGDCAGVGSPRAAKHLQSTARGSPRPQSRHGRGRAVSRAARGRRDGCLTALHTPLSPNIGHLEPNCVAGECRGTTAFHGRHRGRVSFPHKAAKRSDTLAAGETVRTVLTHSDYDAIHFWCRTVQSCLQVISISEACTTALCYSP